MSRFVEPVVLTGARWVRLAPASGRCPHPDGPRRDTVVYSILDVEWPAVRAHLRFRLERDD